MIRDAIRRFYQDYFVSDEFRAWQNEFACEIYAVLTQNLPNAEVRTVTDLCTAMSNKRYLGLRIDSLKTHGRTSVVEFEHNGNQRRELGDMVIFSLVTYNRQIVFLKTAFIQNKKADKRTTASDIWNIDQEQLFLLKNFPTFTGVSGIFREQTLSMLNHSNTLGNFGLFTSTGDMTFLTAQNVFCEQQNNGRIDFDDIKRDSLSVIPEFPCTKFGFCDCAEILIDVWEHSDFKRSFLPIFGGGFGLPFFGNYKFALDVYEIVRQLTYFNIGEPSNVFSRVVNRNLFDFSAHTLKKAFGYYFGDGFVNVEQSLGDNGYWEGEQHVILNHVELGDGR
ncbi:MAG: hypothetical protein LBP75_02665 [Planctomycetota bacterium]|jgi:hypothetical protein|nr:hypothetical protein [Planctomycetota bacterium]